MNNQQNFRKYLFYCISIIILSISIFIVAKLPVKIFGIHLFEVLNNWYSYVLLFLFSFIFIILFNIVFIYIAYKVIEPKDF